MDDVMKKVLMAHPDWKGISQLFSDKQVTIKVLRKQKETYMDPKSLQIYDDAYDPTTKEGLNKCRALREQLDKAIMEDCGLSDYLKDVQQFRILEMILPMYHSDTEAGEGIHCSQAIWWSTIKTETGEGAVQLLLAKKAGEGIHCSQAVWWSTIKTETGEGAVQLLVAKKVCVLNGSFAKLFSDFHDRANFLCVYIAEAHPKGQWSYGTRFSYMEQHHTIDDRIKAARDMIDMDTVHNTFTSSPSDTNKIPLVTDTMDNGFALRYNAFPARVIIIGTNHQVAFEKRNIIQQWEQPDINMADEARHWLEENL